MHFQRPQGGRKGFSRQRRHKKRRPKGRSPRQRSDTIYLPRAEALNPSGRRQPIPDRTLGAQGQRPGGAINPRGEAASTFGNTGKHRLSPDRAEGTIDSAAPFCGEISPLRFAPVEMTMGRPPSVPVPIPTAPEGLVHKKNSPLKGAVFYDIIPLFLQLPAVRRCEPL